MNIDENIASKLAKDTYEKKEIFAKLYKTKQNIITTAVANGVRYYTIEDKKNIVIVIRGTASIKNAITDVMAADANFLQEKKIIVHKGFYTVAQKIFKKIKLSPNKPIVIIGHSLGGAVSLLYGAMLSEMGKDVYLYTFGMPPIVNKRFLKKYKHLKHKRFFHIFDPVATLSKPTVQLFETQIKFKSFQSMKSTISNMISTIENVPDKFRHQGQSNPITDKLNISDKKLKKSLFFKTCTLYFDYHKIDNYIYAIKKNIKPSFVLETDSSTASDNHIKNIKKEQLNVASVAKSVVVKKKKKLKKVKKIKIIPSVLRGTVPLEVEFYVLAQNVDLRLYYFNFDGKEILSKELRNNKVSYTFKTSGKHKVSIALKDKNNKIIKTTLTITTREPTFKEYQDAIGKEFDNYKKSY